MSKHKICSFQFSARQTHFIKPIHIDKWWIMGGDDAVVYVWIGWKEHRGIFIADAIIWIRQFHTDTNKLFWSKTITIPLIFNLNIFIISYARLPYIFIKWSVTITQSEIIFKKQASQLWWEIVRPPNRGIWYSYQSIRISSIGRTAISDEFQIELSTILLLWMILIYQYITFKKTSQCGISLYQNIILL